MFCFAGCDLPPATTPQSSPDAIEPGQTAIQPIEPVAAPKSTPEVSEIIGKVVGVSRYGQSAVRRQVPIGTSKEGRDAAFY